jgi:hypothetical protein
MFPPLFDFWGDQSACPRALRLARQDSTEKDVPSRVEGALPI